MALSPWVQSPKPNQINLIEINCVFEFLDHKHTERERYRRNDGFGHIYAQTEARLDVIRLTVIWFHCHWYRRSTFAHTNLFCAISLIRFAFFFEMCKLVRCWSLTHKIYDHIVNIDQLIVTIWTCKKFHRPNRALQKYLIDSRHYSDLTRVACIIACSVSPFMLFSCFLMSLKLWSANIVRVICTRFIFLWMSFGFLARFKVSLW